MSDFVRKSDVLHLLYGIFNKYRMSTDKTNSICNSFGNEVFEEIKNMPIAYSVDKVVKELETKENEAILKAPNTSDLQNPDYQKWMMKSYGFKEAIEIVKQGGVTDDVCEWKSVKLNYEWKPSCEPNSTYNVCGVAWFKRCPYCGKKIKVVDK